MPSTAASASSPFPTSVAPRTHAVLAGAQQVVEVGHEPAVLDHRGAAGGSALVVDAVAAPVAGAAAVVVGGHEGLCEAVAQLAGVDAGALLDGVGLEAVADGLVEEDAAEAVADHHGEPSRGGVHGVEE